MNRVDEFFKWAELVIIGSAVAAAAASGVWVVFDTFRAWMCGL